MGSTKHVGTVMKPAMAIEHPRLGRHEALSLTARCCAVCPVVPAAATGVYRVMCVWQYRLCLEQLSLSTEPLHMNALRKPPLAQSHSTACSPKT